MSRIFASCGHEITLWPEPQCWAVAWRDQPDDVALTEAVWCRACVEANADFPELTVEAW